MRLCRTASISAMPSLSVVKAVNSAVSLTGKRALVVGGTSGIGAAVALRLAKANCAVTVVGRSVERGNEVVEMMKKVGTAEASFVPCDAKLLCKVRECCEAFTQKNDSLDILVLTQGIASLQDRTPSSENIDEKIGLYYHSRMQFILCLLPILRKSSDPRVLSVLSAGVHSPYKDYKEDPEVITHYGTKTSGDAAGFYNDLAVDSLSRENSGFLFVHAAPGGVNTSWGKEMPFFVRGLVRMIQPFLRSPEVCAEFMCYPLLNPDMKGKGMFLMNKDGDDAKPTQLHSDEAREFMWKHTLEMIERTKELVK